MSGHGVEDVLFAEPDRQRTGALGHAEAAVHWFTEITRPEAIADRAILNAWYRRFPDRDATVATRLRSQDDGQHYPALAEVTVHELLRTRYQDIRYEEGERATDFRAYDGGQLVLSVEVLALLQRASWTAEERQYGRIADALDERVRGRGYMIDVVDLQVTTPPSLTALSRFVDRFIGELPAPTEVSTAYAEGIPLPKTEYRAEGIYMVLAALPLRQDVAPDEEGHSRVVGMGPVIGGAVNSGVRLKTALKGKRASRYDLGEFPYMIAVSNRDPFCSTDQWMNALYGPDRLSLRPEDPIALSLAAENHGLYGQNPKSKRIRVARLSSVLILEQRGPLSVDGLHAFRLDNPNALVPLRDDGVPYSRRFGADPLGAWAWTPPVDQPELTLRLG